MIKTARQLKDLIRNLSKDKAADAQILMRNYMMERFLERISLSEYRDKFILKGGMLVAAMVGLDARSTMDIDATVKGATVGIEEVENMIASIISVPVDDGVEFRVKRISEIMDEAEYPGIRISMETEFDGVITPLKTDISTGDAITPREVRYSFKLMLEDRSIEIWAYNLETVLAEKLETVVSRATTNTRMRDFYDLHILSRLHGQSIVPADLRAALIATAKKRGTEKYLADAPAAFDEVEADSNMEKRSGNLLVDIQAKLRAGKGAGYARWATLFNLKQMAQTVAYLQDHELLDYAILSEKAAAASAHFNELSARIKSAETRMAEIAVLREHIVGYAKTRDTYVAYRKAGYSKKFLAEHESEITIHKAAKNYFDGLGFKKLPTVKALNTEYAELLAEKKAAYADYRKAREEMKELLTAKANIDRILELDKELEEANERREKEAEQR